MKAQDSLPLVSHPENMPRQWPNVASDHSLPWRHATTEAGLVTLLVLCIVAGAGVLLNVREPALWAFALFVTLVMGIYVLLRRYEDHVAYVRSDRTPTPAAPLDLDADGKPDKVRAIWYGNGAPTAYSGTLDGIYRQKFAEFCAACQAGGKDGTTIRYLRSSGFPDDLQVLFRNWLMEYDAAQWVSERGRTPGWEITSEDALRKVLRNTGWQEAQ